MIEFMRLDSGFPYHLSFGEVETVKTVSGEAEKR